MVSIDNKFDNQKTSIFNSSHAFHLLCFFPLEGIGNMNKNWPAWRGKSTTKTSLRRCTRHNTRDRCQWGRWAQSIVFWWNQKGSSVDINPARIRERSNQMKIHDDCVRSTVVAWLDVRLGPRSRIIPIVHRTNRAQRCLGPSCLNPWVMVNA